MVDFLITTIGVKPENCVIMANDEDYNEVIKEIRDWYGESNTTKQFYRDANDKKTRKYW